MASSESQTLESNDGDDTAYFDQSDFYVGPSNVYPCRRGIPPQSSLTSSLDGLELYDDHEMVDSSLCPQSEKPTFGEELAVSSRNLAAEFDERLTGTMDFDDGSIAFGTIRVYERRRGSSLDVVKCIRGNDSDDEYQHLLIKLGLQKKWLRLDGLSIGTRDEISSIRVYVLPEDVDRAGRGQIKDFRKMVKYLLRFVDCSSAAWTGRADPHGPIVTYKEPAYESEESLFYMFNTLDSPNPDLSSFKGNYHGCQAMRDAFEGRITGLKAKLYPYQMRSVATMVKREADPAKIRDPRKIKMLDLYGKAFYLDVNGGALYRSQPVYNEPTGGILAETMGYGKTVICLALILATRGHYPAIPHHCIEAQETEHQTTTRTPSLMSMAAKKLKYEGLPWKTEFYRAKKEGYHYDRCIEELQSYQRVYNEPTAGMVNPTRRGKPEYTNLIRLSSATLIIVPPNLIIQWVRQIKEHVDEDAMDYLVVDSPIALVPRWQDLVKYDMILMSKARFEQEYRDDDLHQGKSSKYEGKYKSPLTEVRWLRVICDEGHGFAGSSTKTNAMAMLDKMYIERRWVVSGTPSRTLHGVELGIASADSDFDDEISARRDSFASILTQRRIPHEHKEDAKDLERLRLIVVNFLKLRPWANKMGDDQADWKTYLAPKVEAHGKRHSLPALREVLQTLIVRHRIQDLDADLQLPALHNRVVFLEPSYYDKLSINLFIMILASNYVTSEREDEDYMFHPRNRGKLTTLINNFAQATFYWTAIIPDDVRGTLEISNKYLDRNIDRVSDDDGCLLTNSIQAGNQALADPGWQAITLFHEMGVHLASFPSAAQAQWALDGRVGDQLLIGTTQAREVQKYVKCHLQKDTSKETSLLSSHGCKIMDLARTKAAEELKLRRTRSANDAQHDAGIIETTKRASTSSTPIKTLPRARSMKASNSCSTDLDNELSGLSKTQILGFASAKLTYICEKLLSHPEEKSIVFYNHNNMAFYIGDALELLGIPFLIYANTLTVAKRGEYHHQFETDEETKVLLMDLKQAGQGLHIAAASRVYIVNPIWDPALESQAIKRAHRIGQTREVHVETIVLKHTFEEALVKRRKERSEIMETDTSGMGSETNKLTPSKMKRTPPNPMLDDSVMVKFLKNIKFLHVEEGEDKMARLSKAVPLIRQETTARSNAAYEQQQALETRQVPPSDISDLPGATDVAYSVPATTSIFGPRSATPAKRQNASLSTEADATGIGQGAQTVTVSKRVKFV